MDLTVSGSRFEDYSIFLVLEGYWWSKKGASLTSPQIYQTIFHLKNMKPKGKFRRVCCSVVIIFRDYVFFFLDHCIATMNNFILCDWFTWGVRRGVTRQDSSNMWSDYPRQK